MAELPKAAQGTFDELLAGVEPDLAAIARRLRAMIRAVDVSTDETVRLGDNAATYGVGPKKMTDGYAYIMPMRGYINLGFYQGAVLADPERLLEGTGKGLRHVKICSLAEANRPPVRRWWQRHSPADGGVPPVGSGRPLRAARGEQDLPELCPFMADLLRATCAGQQHAVRRHAELCHAGRPGALPPGPTIAK